MIDSGSSSSSPKRADSCPEGDRWPQLVAVTPLLEGPFLDSLESAAAAAVLILLGQQAEELGESQADAWTQGAS